MTPPLTIKTLVQGFAQHIRILKSPDYKESQARLQYIDSFWELLGWDVRNEKQCPPQDVEVMVEPSMDTMEDDKYRSRMPDYLFRLNGFGRFIVEAKKPAVNLETDKPAIYQAKRYAWNATIPFAILMNFEQFRLYDTTLKPSLHDPERGFVREFSFDFPDYPSQWEEIQKVFGRAAVAEGSLEQLRAKIRKVPPGRRLRTVDRMLFDLKGDEPVDRVFLDYLEKYRQRFACDIYHENKTVFPEADTLHGAARLTEAVQRLIDRLVFMRVCEDRGVTKWGNLRDLLTRVSAERGDFYAALCLEFRDLDREFNGYLYKYHLSDTLKVPGDILADFIRDLYPPEAPWDFSVIRDDILGIVYERFLGNVVTVRHNQAVVEEKPEVRHAGGVYYTPSFVVDTIIRRVIGPQIADKKPMQVLDIKILDPACGSGSFLVAAFQFLIDHCLKAIAGDPSLALIPAIYRSPKKHRELAFQDKKGRWHLAPDFTAALLIHCIHGVDIDQQAVEVTVMSLYLKMLEGELPPRWQHDWLESELLPPLDNNILCGNSLIDSIEFDRYCEYKLGGLFPADEDIKFRINRFDWTSRTRGFGKLLAARAIRENGHAGFDCIIGNPPYIRVQELNQWAPDECQFYKWKYKSAAKGNYDIYVVFVERCLDLLSPEGLLGFIMPHKFWQAQYGEGLRRLISDGKHLRSVIDFRQEQVFRNASTYTAIHVFSRAGKNKTVNYTGITRLYDGVQQMTDIDKKRSRKDIEYATTPHPTDGNWIFVKEGTRVRSLMSAAGIIPLHTVARLAQGIKTSADKIFVVEIRKNDSRYSTIFSNQTGLQHLIERKLLWPLVKSEHMKRFVIEDSSKALLFPYERAEGHFRPIPVSRWKNEFPKAWEYLNENKSVLKARERGKMANREDWYSYIYPKNFKAMGKAKLIIPDISQHAQICIDAKGRYIFSGGAAGGNAIIPNDPSLLYYLSGLLNSRLIEAELRQTGTKFRGGYLNCEIRFIRDLPIKLPETAAEKKLAERIVASVHAIADAKIKLRSPTLSDRECKVLEGEVEAHEHKIDTAVLALYGVDNLPDF